jgi:hypothetical protein
VIAVVRFLIAAAAARRGFGGSGGLPRHWVSPKRHIQDWQAVVAHVQVSRQRSQGVHCECSKALDEPVREGTGMRGGSWVCSVLDAIACSRKKAFMTRGCFDRCSCVLLLLLLLRLAGHQARRAS